MVRRTHLRTDIQCMDYEINLYKYIYIYIYICMYCVNHLSPFISSVWRNTVIDWTDMLVSRTVEWWWVVLPMRWMNSRFHVFHPPLTLHRIRHTFALARFAIPFISNLALIYNLDSFCVAFLWHDVLPSMRPTQTCSRSTIGNLIISKGHPAKIFHSYATHQVHFARPNPHMHVKVLWGVVCL